MSVLFKAFFKTLRRTTYLLFLTLWRTTVLLYLSAWYISKAVIETLTPRALLSRRSLAGRIVLVTGGAGGVGKQLARCLARRRATVVLWDVDEDGLEEIKRELSEEGHQVHTYVVDVSDRRSVYKYADLVKSEIGEVDVLVNNAGVVAGRSLLELPEEAIERTYNVNILSHYWTTKSFLKSMMARGDGHVVTVSSVAGLLGTHLCTDYSGSKFAAVGFHEALFTELRIAGARGVHCTLVCPYYIDTGMFEGVKPSLLPMLRPKHVAERIVQSLERPETLIVMPTAVRYLLPLKSWLPAELCWLIMHRVLRGPQAMTTFKGHPNKFIEPAAA